MKASLSVRYQMGVVPVPLQPLVVVAVEEVRLGSHRPDVRVQPQELQQRPGASLLHPDDDRLGQLFTLRLIEETRHGIIIQRLRLASNLIPLLSSAVQVVLVIQEVPGRTERRAPAVSLRVALVSVRQVGHRGAVSDAAVDHVDPEGQHDAEHEEFVLHVGWWWHNM